jgi:anti-anti-sigma factor
MRLERDLLDWGALRVRLSGRMDIAGVESVSMPLAALAAADGQPIVLDVSDVDFLASIGVRAILQTARARQARGGGLVLLAPRPLVEEVLRAAGVVNVVPIVPDLDAARAALAA